MGYLEGPQSGVERLLTWLEKCKIQHKIPCDLFHLSSGYSTDPINGRRYVMEWNKTKFPTDVKASLSDIFHKNGVHLTANIKPCLLTTHPRFNQVSSLKGFIQQQNINSSQRNDNNNNNNNTTADDKCNLEPLLIPFWSGGPGEAALGSYIDFLSGPGFDWWKQRIIDALHKNGIESVWNDNNEY